MKKVLLLAISCLICFCACNQKRETVFHDDVVIDSILQKYNTISGVKIGKEVITNQFPYQVFFELEGVWIRIAHNDNLKQVFFTFEQESKNITDIKKICSLFLRTVNQNLIDEEINKVFTELETYKYNAYNAYNYRDFDFSLTKEKLGDSKNSKFCLKVSHRVN